jgi:hypothetical protein
MKVRGPARWLQRRGVPACPTHAKCLLTRTCCIWQQRTADVSAAHLGCTSGAAQGAGVG